MITITVSHRGIILTLYNQPLSLISHDIYSGSRYVRFYDV